MREKVIQVCDKIIWFSILAIIFLVPVYFAFLQENFNVFELNKLVVFRLFLHVLLLAYVAKIFIKGSFSILPSPKIFLLVFVIGTSFLLSTIFSIHPQLSLWGDYHRQQGFYSLISYLLFFVLLVLNLKKWEQVKKIIVTLLLASAPICFYGLMQYFGFDPLVWQRSAFYIGRIFSSLGQPNFLGHYLIIVLPITLYSLFFIFKKTVPRFFISVLALSQFLCLIFTYSRAAWFGLTAIFILFIILFLLINNYKKSALLITFLIFISIIAVILNFNAISKKIDFNKQGKVAVWERVVNIFNLQGSSNKIRIYYWRSALNEFRETDWRRKLFGFGPETEASIFVKYYRPDWGANETINSFPDRAHNLIFDTLLQFGSAGMIAILLFNAYIIYHSVRYLTYYKDRNKEFWLIVVLLATLAGYFINNLFSFSLTVAYIYLFIYYAVIVFLISRSNQERVVNINLLGNISKLFVWLSLFIVCIMFIYFQDIKAIRADYYYMKVKKAEARKDCKEILNNINRAVGFNPSSTFYKERYIYYNLNCLASSGLKEEQIIMRDNMIAEVNSIKSKEYKFSTWLNIAHAKSLFGFYVNPDYYNEAEEIYNKLIKINPYITSAYKDLGRLKLWQKDYDAAISELEQAIKVLPPLNNLYFNSEHKKEIEDELLDIVRMMGQAYSYKKKWDKAIYYYEQALKLNSMYLPLYKNIADVYYQKGDLDKAIWYNKRGYMLNPNDYTWPFSLALLYKEKGNKVLAMKHVQEALKLSPGNKNIENFINEFNYGK